MCYTFACMTCFILGNMSKKVVINGCRAKRKLVGGRRAELGHSSWGSCENLGLRERAPSPG